MWRTPRPSELFPLFPEDPVVKCDMGDFFYSEYEFDDIQVGMFKYNDPRNPNADGLIYKVTHKNVSWLLFGDFDNPAALANLLEYSEINHRRYLEIQEEIFALEGELHIMEQQLYDMEGQKAQPDALEALIAAMEKKAARQMGLGMELLSLPTIRADIVKWPHHAHVFKSRELIEKMNAVINPRYFIYQAHPAQEDDPKNPVKFKQMIEGLDFKDKFIKSAEYDVEIISLYFLRIMDRYLSFVQTTGGLSSKKK
jgi:hypothetical protein